MKFLCVRCDEAMKLERVGTPEEDGSLGVVFACAACGNQVAMLTNPMETQLVRALDVRIGGRSSPVEPMEFVRSMLASRGEAKVDTASPSASGSGAAPQSKCPFSAVANVAAEPPDMAGCVWAPEAERRLERIPEFIRPMIRQGIEQFAAQRGYGQITEAVMAEARGALGM
jgi:hypothetical protein